MILKTKIDKYIHRGTSEKQKRFAAFPVREATPTISLSSNMYK